MQWNESLFESVPLVDVAETTAPWTLEHFPTLISDEAVRHSPKAAADRATARLRAGRPATFEVLSMPKGVTGIRPIVYPDLATRLAYNSLVIGIEDSLAVPTRRPANQADFETFGTEHDSATHVVISDVASCYEYISPETMLEELLIRTDNYAISAAITSLMQEMSTLGRGLPQMMEASDLLSDTYLSRVDRTLDRKGFEWSRVADDFKIASESWREANAALEFLESQVRALGLMLSTSKTTIVQVGPKARRISSGPGAAELVEGEAEQEGDTQDTAVERLKEWHRTWTARKTLRDRGSLVPPAILPPTRELQIAASASEALAPQLLADIVFSDPVAIEYVFSYMQQASAITEADSSSLLNMLIVESGQSAFSKIWLLKALSLRPLADNGKAFALASLDDPREAVRAEAAWLLASNKLLKRHHAETLHANASELTIPGIAAAISLSRKYARTHEIATLTQLLDGVAQGDALSRAAASWAEK